MSEASLLRLVQEVFNPNAILVLAPLAGHVPQEYRIPSGIVDVTVTGGHHRCQSLLE